MSALKFTAAIMLTGIFLVILIEAAESAGVRGLWEKVARWLDYGSE